MTNDELQGHIAAIEEAANAGIIEEKASNDWCPLRGEFVLLGPYQYRIAPKPLECWVNVHEYSGTLSAVVYDSEQEAIDGGDFKLPPVHMRAVSE